MATKDLTRILTTPGVQARVRAAMQSSPVHRADHALPQQLSDLLAELDRRTGGQDVPKPE